MKNKDNFDEDDLFLKIIIKRRVVKLLYLIQNFYQLIEKNEEIKIKNL